MIGTTTSPEHSCCAVSESVPSGSNLRLSTTVVQSPMASVKWAKPQAWKSGAAIIVRPRAFSGIRSSSAATGSSDWGCLRLAPFGVPVVPEVRISALPCSGGGERSEVSRGARDQVLERAVRTRLVRLVPGDEALAALARGGEHLGELVVVDHHHRVLALRDVGELRPAERGVEEQRVRPELVRGDVGLDPAAVVAAHDRDAVARADALGGERVGERVRALVDLAEGERPGLVDDREVVGEAGGGGLEAGGGRRAPADQRARGVEQPVRPLWADDPRAREGRHRLHLAGDVAGARDPHGRDYPTVRATSSRTASRPSRSGGGCRPRGAG